MEIIFSPEALEDLNFWKATGNEKILKRIRLLIESIQQDAFHGIGKPEPLKYNFSRKWSRRINKEHRIIYECAANIITVHALKEHY